MPLSGMLRADEIAAIARSVERAAEEGRTDDAWKALRPLLRAQAKQKDAAAELTAMVERRYLPIDRGLEVLVEIERAHPDDSRLLASIGDATAGARDIDDLNSAPPEHALFATVVDKLARIAATVQGEDTERHVLSGLATAARMCGRQHDDLAAASYRRLVELDPKRASAHYNYGLFCKTRGRFREGLDANKTAASLVEQPDEAYEWNLGICATGAREGAFALEVWKRMSQKIAMGRFDLPEGRYPQCKVKLAERPLAERTADRDDPGLEETIWIERLSPCHGIVRSVLYQDLGVDYGDVVLIDGAPITYHKYGDDQVPVFPHLATLIRSGYRFFDFAGTQDASGRVADVSRELAEDAIVYSHTESYRTLCASCWRNADLDHEHEGTEKKHVVAGRIAAPKHIEPTDLLAQLDRAMATRTECSVYVPALCEAAGALDRAAVERRRFDLLRNN